MTVPQIYQIYHLKSYIARDDKTDQTDKSTKINASECSITFMVEEQKQTFPRAESNLDEFLSIPIDSVAVEVRKIPLNGSVQTAS